MSRSKNNLKKIRHPSKQLHKMRVRHGTRHGTSIELPKLPIFLFERRPSIGKSKCY